MDSKDRLVIVSNRLPLVMEHKDGDWHVQPGSGGLVTALAPVLRNRGGMWIGWPGTVDPPTDDLRRAIDEAVSDLGYDLAPVFLDAEEKYWYYSVFSNQVLWPLFHDMTSRCRFEPRAWKVYTDVNRRFAETIANRLQPRDFLWIHDYHLMQVGRWLREMGADQRIGFFLHIPFPPVDIFMKLPWRRQILHDLLQFDLLGFQTQRDRRNFARAVAALLHDAVRVRTAGQRTSIDYENRHVMCGAFPIGIDYGDFAQGAADESVAESAWYLHENYPERQIFLGVDRLDYTKGIPEKLRAFRHMLRTHPEMCEKATLVQVTVPSRWDIPHYEELKHDIERLVGEINGQFTRPGWIPIHYYYRSLSRRELLAYYRTAEVLVVSSWKDGMNLVAKEYCACKEAEPGVLTLSEFTGAAAQLHKQALMFNPHDIAGMADTMHEALIMPEDERRQRMATLKRNVQKQSVFWWVDRYLQAALQRRLSDFPTISEFYPDETRTVTEAG